MKTILKTLIFGTLFSAILMLVTGCNTVKGAFQGAGQDTKSVAHALQLDDQHSVRKSHYHNEIGWVFQNDNISE